MNNAPRLDKCASSGTFIIMRYINPKTDFAFKKIFGSPGSHGILRSFLNGVLYEGLPRIATLEIVDPYSIPRLAGMKDSYLDVRAVLDDGQHVIIEMQVLNVPGMEKRVLYNAAKEYSNQLSQGQDYQMLNPVIALTLTDFIMFPELGPEQVISRFALMEKSQMIAYPQGDVELVFVELPKFHAGLEELRTLTDKWLYFVSSAAGLQEVPEKLGAVTEIGDAFGIAETARLTPEEDHALELKLRWIADQKMLLAMKLGAEERAAFAEQKALESESKALVAESNAQLAEQKALESESKALVAESNAQVAEQKALESESKALAEVAAVKALAAEQAAAIRRAAIKALIAAGLSQETAEASMLP